MSGRDQIVYVLTLTYEHDARLELESKRSGVRSLMVPPLDPPPTVRGVDYVEIYVFCCFPYIPIDFHGIIRKYEEILGNVDMFPISGC